MTGRGLDGITGRIDLNERGVRVGAPVSIYRFDGSYPGAQLSPSGVVAATDWGRREVGTWRSGST